MSLEARVAFRLRFMLLLVEISERTVAPQSVATELRNIDLEFGTDLHTRYWCEASPAGRPVLYRRTPDGVEVVNLDGLRRRSGVPGSSRYRSR